MEMETLSSSRSADIQSKPIVFGQIVIGPPGSGKSTYCKTMQDVLTKLGRNVLVINLDPGNDIQLPYDVAVDVCELITVEDVMSVHQLGPNGGLIHCMEFLETNYDWLIEKISTAIGGLKNPYLLIDSPGQVELYIHNSSLKNVINRLTAKSCPLDFRLCAVNLVDSYYANDPGKYVSALFTCLTAMLHFELPHVNVLSKLDLMEKYRPTDFNLEFYCEVLDLSQLLQMLSDDPFFSRYKRLTGSIAEIVEQYGLVNFVPLNINDNRTIMATLNLVDKANGFFLVRIETEQHKMRFYEDYFELQPPPPTTN